MEEEAKLVSDSDFKQDEYDLHLSVSQMITRVNDVDEFDYFGQLFRKAHAANPEQMNSLLQTSFKPKHRNYLKTIIASKRVQIYGGGSFDNIKK